MKTYYKVDQGQVTDIDKSDMRDEIEAGYDTNSIVYVYADSERAALALSAAYDRGVALRYTDCSETVIDTDVDLTVYDALDRVSDVIRDAVEIGTYDYTHSIDLERARSWIDGSYVSRIDAILAISAAQRSELAELVLILLGTIRDTHDAVASQD